MQEIFLNNNALLLVCTNATGYTLNRFKSVFISKYATIKFYEIPQPV